MKQATQSSFNEGLLMDMNPLVTPQTCLSDCLNGTLVTFNGNEFTLQNDSGNVVIEGGILPNGFIPVGMKEYGGIIYTALLNPVTNMCQIGSIPSPDYSKQPKDQAKEGVIVSFDGDDTFNNAGTETTGYEFKNKIIKLFEFDQMVLNPGDEYKIVYQVLPGNKNISGIYKVNWLAIDESGKIYDLKDPNIVDSKTKNYKYFNQTIRAILGLEVTLNNIDWFEIAGTCSKNDDNAFDVTIKLFGKNKIKRSGVSDDDLYIRGCKIKYLSDDNIPAEYYWDQNIYNAESNGQTVPESALKDTFKHDVNVNMTFAADEEVRFEVTPFDQFRMLDELKRTIFLKMGQVYSSEGLNELFQYKYSSSNKSLRLDFNANLQGINDPAVYLEFYDIWSDYSVIVPINDPNPFGKNSVFISTSSEKCTKEFNDDIWGGIEKRQLSVFDDDKTIYKPTLFGPNKYIRKNQILRENNLYIVKITIVENSSEIDVAKRAYHNTYKVFTLNENMNANYEEYQLSENPLFKDFSILPQKMDKVNIKYNPSEIVDDTPEITLPDPNLKLKTGDYYYSLKTDDSINTSSPEKCIKTITKKRSYLLDLSVDQSSIGYGAIDGFKLNAGVQATNINKNIVETDETITSTESTVVIKPSVDNKILVENTLTTHRTITAEIKKENRNVRSELKKFCVWDTIIKGANDSPHGYIRTWGNYHHPRRITVGDTTNAVVGVDSINTSAITSYINSRARRLSGGVLYWNNTPGSYRDVWGDKHDRFCTSKIKSSGNVIPAHINNFLICLLNKNGNFYPVFTNDPGSAVEALKNIYSSVVKNTDYRLYYYGNITSDKESTSYTKPEFLLSGASTINFIQNFAVDGSIVGQDGIIKKVNQIINIAEQNEGNLAEGVEYISEKSNKYLQVIDTSSNIDFTIKLSELEITDGVDRSMLNKLTTSKSDLEFNEASKLINSNLPDLTPYSSTYSGIASKFSVSYETLGDNTPGNPVFTYNHSNLQRTRWAVEGKGDRNDEDGYDIDISIFEL